MPLGAVLEMAGRLRAQVDAAASDLARTVTRYVLAAHLRDGMLQGQDIAEVAAITRRRGARDWPSEPGLAPGGRCVGELPPQGAKRSGVPGVAPVQHSGGSRGVPFPNGKHRPRRPTAHMTEEGASTNAPDAHRSQ
jgi:hypothetical protein